MSSGARQSPAPFTMDQIIWSVRCAGTRIPGTTCLVKALVGHWMLRRAGIAAELKIGIQNTPVFKAHAWVVVDSKIIIGASETTYTELPLEEALF